MTPRGPDRADALRVRDASLGDAHFVAWVMQEAGRSHLPRGTWEWALPGSESERLDWLARLAAADARSFCHASRFLIGEVDGVAAAALCGYRPREAPPALFLEAVRQVKRDLGWTRGQVAELFRRLAPFETCAGDPDPDAWIVEWVATRPEHRGRGHASRLLRVLLERGRERGLARAHVGVLIGNHAAQRVYEQAGFRVVGEKRHPDFQAAMGEPGMRFLERSLTGALFPWKAQAPGRSAGRER